MTTAPRDTQRLKVYRADWALWPARPEFKTVDECQAFVTKVLASAWYRGAYPTGPRHVSVRHGGGASSARAVGSWAIEVPANLRIRQVLLHELAHNITTRLYGQDGTPWHGWQFCAVYLRLVQRWLGRAFADRLVAEWKRTGVKYRQPRAGRVLTAAERQTLVDRLAAARAARGVAKAAVPPAPAAPTRNVALDIALARAGGC